jgi:endonuclease YncB( thermonuclease family)
MIRVPLFIVLFVSGFTIGVSLGLKESAAKESHKGRVVEVTRFDQVKLDDGRLIRLQGIGLPGPLVRPAAMELELRDALTRKVLWGTFSLLIEEDPGAGAEGETVATLLPLDPVVGNGGSRSVNAELLAEGLAVLSCRTRTVARAEDLAAAAEEAKRGRKGWFGGTEVIGGGPPPKQHGAVLGLYYREEKYDYRRHIDELADAGAPWVSLLLSAFVHKIDSHEIERDNPRTVTDARLIETIVYARKRGIRLMLLPIVLVRDCPPEDWRGTFVPKDEEAFWLDYDRFLSHYADICQKHGVEVLSIGSEFCKLEEHPRFTEAWRRIIGNLRGRYAGWLTYSVNWDHVDVPQFWDALDFVGMTGYFSVTDKNDPTLEELVEGWRKIRRDKVEPHQKRIGKPMLFTEIGYPSIDGANKDPWDYITNKDQLDLEEQADATRAFVLAWKGADFLLGAYLFDFFENGGPEDTSYSPRGKPVLEVWKEWFR